MKLRVAVERLRLGLEASALKLALGVQRLKVELVAFNRLKLAVAVGIFIRFLEKQDNFFVQSLVAKLLQRSISEDAIQVTDDDKILFVKSRSDAAALSDGEPYFEEDYVEGAPLAQTYTEGRQPNWVMTKPLTEAPVVSDLFTPVFVTARSDSFAVSDAAGITLSTIKTESTIVSDVVLRVIQNAYSETPTLSDAGSLRSQGYAEFDYFAEDYVGESRAF